MKIALNDIQKTVLRQYCNGEFADISTYEELENCGDGLLRFLMVELSSEEDCTDLFTAAARIEAAQNQLAGLWLSVTEKLR